MLIIKHLIISKCICSIVMCMLNNKTIGFVLFSCKIVVVLPFLFKSSGVTSIIIIIDCRLYTPLLNVTWSDKTSLIAVKYTYSFYGT